DQLQEKSDVCACQQGLFHQVLSHVLLGVQILIFCIKCKLSHKCYKMQFSGFFLLIFCFSLLKYTYYYKLAKSAGVQILTFPTVSIYLSVCLSVCLSICLSVCLSVCLSICISICLSVCLSLCLSSCVRLCLFLLCLSIYLYIYLSVCLSVSLSVFLSLSLSLSLPLHF